MLFKIHLIYLNDKPCLYVINDAAKKKKKDAQVKDTSAVAIVNVAECFKMISNFYKIIHCL